MHGLIGDRLLKRFLKGIRRKSEIVSANEAGSKLARGTELTDRSNCLENDQPQGKEEEENIEKTNDPHNALEMTSGIAQPPDDLEKTK